MEIILDVGSERTLDCIATAKKMVDEIKAIDTGKHTIIFKAQLFQDQSPNIPLAHGTFEALYKYGRSNGYKVTASVFDMESLEYLLQFDVPFIKIACRPELRWIRGEVPRKIPIYISADFSHSAPEHKEEVLFCVPKYPAKIEEYLPIEGTCCCSSPNVINISDHTIGLAIFKIYENRLHIWEKHLRLPETTGPDAGPFAILPSELKEIL